MDLGGFYSRGAGAANLAAGGGGFDFMGLLKNAGGKALSWLGDSDAAGTPNWMNALGMAGNMYSGIAQQQAAKNLMKQQKAAFDFNKMLSERQIARENQANQNLLNAWNSSAFSKRKDEDEGY
nr:MAG TPA: hypothetical protein [Caudoviricetes sp.]